VILELYSGEVLTASEAAEICGLTPSAMSYHLRALQKAGMVEREESADRRERPWRAAAEGDARGGLSRGRLWVAEDEARELAEEVLRLWDRYQGRTRASHPEGATLRDVFSIILPAEDR